MSEPKAADGKNFDLCDLRVVHLDRVVVAKERAVPRGLVDGLSALFKALGDATRLRLVLALRDQEMCVCDLAAALGMTESAVSHQLRRLRDQALVAARREGQVVYYSLDDEHVAALLEVGLLHASEVSR
jgi:DNA-binding transcriptional ArsR family regulator